MITEEQRQVLDLFSEGRKRYKLMDFQNALGFFDRALKIDPADGPSKVYRDRCEHYIANPPPDDWDGVFVMTTK